MGSLAILKIGDLWVGEMKSAVPREIVSLFRDSDLVVHSDDLLRWDLHLESTVPAPPHILTLSVGHAISRLDAMGFTLPRAQAAFEEGIFNYRDSFGPWYDDEGYESAPALRNLTFQDYLKYLSDVFTSPYSLFDTQLTSQLTGASAFLHEDFGEDFFWSFPSADPRWALRLLLDKFDRVKPVTLDVSQLVDNDYIEDVSRYCEDTRATLASETAQISPVIVLTEGSSDSMILQASLALMYPELTDHFSFLDFSFLNLQGGAPELVRTIKSFATAGVANRVIALFDNDSAAHDALSNLDQEKLPENIRVLHYPNLALASSYPTLGPAGGIQLMDINGWAVSLELCFGSEVLTDANGALKPIRWTGYLQKLKRYQGEVEGKAELQKRFMAVLTSLQGQPPAIVRGKLPDMAQVMNGLREAFN